MNIPVLDSMTNRFARTTLSLWFLAAGVAHAQAPESLIVNGSFEQGPGVRTFLNLQGGNESLPGWILSENRAAAVKEWLVAGGIPAARITTRGFGATVPVATNDTAEGRQQNRRVEVRVQK